MEDANEKFLTIGYRRRDKGGATTPSGRQVMGRKGIGKLSLFSIAELVEVYSVRNRQRHGFKMDIKEIQKEIGRDSGAGEYTPEPIAPNAVDLSAGTRIVLRQMKRRLNRSSDALRRRLARRFSVISGNDFEITLDGRPVRIEDRGYQDKLQYIWTYGSKGDRIKGMANRIEESESRSLKVNSAGDEWVVDGWVGSVHEVKDLTDSDTRESINQIVLMVRGKLAQEDILDEFGIGGLATKYFIGEIHADFLDVDDMEDIATTSRQRIIEEDPRYKALKKQLGADVRRVVNEWRDMRSEGGVKRARKFPQIERWFEELNSDQKKAARKLLGQVNQIPVESEDGERQLLIGSILAFESLRFRNMLHRLNEVSTENLGELSSVFAQLDDLEASAYYQIAKDRLEVISKLVDLVGEDAIERAVQEHLFSHLWLLDPSWERATHTEQMETRITRALKGVCESLTSEEQMARLDIYYATTGRKHVIIELKRPGRVVDTFELLGQIRKYRRAALTVLKDMGQESDPLEIICVVGKRLRDWDEDPNEKSVSEKTLEQYGARVVLYDQLISNAQQAYGDYIKKKKEAGRIYELIASISEEDFADMSPESG